MKQLVKKLPFIPFLLVYLYMLVGLTSQNLPVIIETRNTSLI